VRSLLLLRHAKSSWKEPGLDDHDRPLNKRGKQDAPRMGRFLGQRRLIPDVIISSTAVRARTTAEEVARHCGFGGEVQRTERLYLAEPAEILDLLAGLTSDPRIAMVVGHNPGMTELLELLTGKSRHVPTAALAHIALPIEQWSELHGVVRGELLDLWLPKELPGSEE
jgi:phosphohistidine phosphatase